MKEKHVQSNAFLEGPILPPLVRFALPVILSLFVQGVFGAVSTCRGYTVRWTWQWWDASLPLLPQLP